MPAPLLHTLTFFLLALLIFGTAALLYVLWLSFMEKKNQEEAPKTEQNHKEKPQKEPFPQCLRQRHRYLVHFTRVENLDSILRHGLVPRDQLEKLAPDAICNDSARQDGRCYTISLSLEFPNDRMLYRYMKQCEEEGDNSRPWCVLLLDPAILAEKKCLFCARNAAHYSMRQQQDAMLSGQNAYNAMFADDGTRSPSLPPNYPTDSQAEILVPENIEARYIRYLVFDRGAQADRFRKRYPDRKILYQPFYFSSRQQLYGGEKA